ncbi:MAG: HIT domain-containing protein [Pseudomonadota bacterium]
MGNFYIDEAIPRKTPIDVVMETDEVLAFHHTRPYWPIHIVVVPKEPVPSLTDLGDHGPGLLSTVMDVVRKVAALVEAEHGACRVLTNLGTYQDSKHLHFHVSHGRSYGRNLEVHERNV